MGGKRAQLANVALSDTDGSYTEIGNILSVDPSKSTALIDTTDNDSAGHMESLAGDKQIILAVTGNHDITDAGQLEFDIAEATSVLKFYRYQVEAASGQLELRFQARVSAYTPGGGDTAGRQEFSFTIESTGAITRALQA